MGNKLSGNKKEFGRVKLHSKVLDGGLAVWPTNCGSSIEGYCAVNWRGPCKPKEIQDTKDKVKVFQIVFPFWFWLKYWVDLLTVFRIMRVSTRNVFIC